MNKDLSKSSYLNLEHISNPLNEDDDLKIYNSNQTLNFYDSKYHIEYEYPGYEFEAEDYNTEVKRLINESTINSINEYDIFDKKKNLILLMV